MRIYLAGKMSNVELFNYPAFDLNAGWLRGKNHDVVSPAEISREAGFSEFRPAHQFTEAHYHETMLRNYTALLTCDAIAFMPGWETSKGSRLERDLAFRIGLPMYRVDATNDYFEREVIIGIGGYAQSGKDTLASLLIEHVGFERDAFADTLKKILYATNPSINIDGQYVTLQSVVDEIGWDEAKTRHPEVRKLQQRMGTEGGRTHIHEDIWAKVVLEFHTHGPRLAIPDTRFRNEADLIHRSGGYVVRIDRDGVGPANDHASELLDIDPDSLSPREALDLLYALHEEISS